MEETEAAPSTEQGDDKDDTRRDALRTLGKAALYTAPAVIATLVGTRAMAAS